MRRLKRKSSRSIMKMSSQTDGASPEIRDERCSGWQVAMMSAPEMAMRDQIAHLRAGGARPRRCDGWDGRCDTLTRAHSKRAPMRRSPPMIPFPTPLDRASANSRRSLLRRDHDPSATSWPCRGKPSCATAPLPAPAVNAANPISRLDEHASPSSPRNVILQGRILSRVILNLPNATRIAATAAASRMQSSPRVRSVCGHASGRRIRGRASVRAVPSTSRASLRVIAAVSKPAASSGGIRVGEGTHVRVADCRAGRDHRRSVRPAGQRGSRLTATRILLRPPAWRFPRP